MTCLNPWACVRTTAHEGGETGRGCVHHATTDDLGHGRHSEGASDQ